VVEILVAVVEVLVAEHRRQHSQKQLPKKDPRSGILAHCSYTRLPLQKAPAILKRLMLCVKLLRL
jgi:hypothetical protein